MKIEKISDTQVKLILNRDDLKDKDIKPEDFTISSDKTKELFHDILSTALEECGFEIDDAPLMVEALPVAKDSIMIIVTKLNDDSRAADSSGDSPAAPIISKDLHRYKRNTIKIHNSECSDSSNILIYSFGALDDVIDTCTRISEYKFVASSVHKYNNRYYLVLQGGDEEKPSYIYILNEYGIKEPSGIIPKYHLIEHGEPIIAENALEILAENFA